ncbi:uncharacterized protein LOC131597918 [Vicia villosa]|uniref:uncharacterized protein LOC131597918 n=1 Tax=Vicia villosa TaxID=3911 RepID=UPI00273B1A37|nr:uncharacterized protein LOC131597918 [Vicia villosa]
MVVVGRNDFVLIEKLWILKNSLRWWNQEIFGRFYWEVEKGVREINEGDDAVGGENDLYWDIISLTRKEALSRFWLNLKIKENMLIRIYRLKWLNDGDSNSKYFHNVMKERMRRNFIGSINSDRGILEAVSKVKEEVLNHFALKFSEPEISKPGIVGIPVRRLNQPEKAFLEPLFMDLEIKEAVSKVKEEVLNHFALKFSEPEISRPDLSWLTSLSHGCGVLRCYGFLV